MSMNRRKFLGAASVAAATGSATVAALAASKPKAEAWEPTPHIGYRRNGRAVSLVQKFVNVHTKAEEWRPLQHV